MVDIVSRSVRSRMMAGIRGRDTKPEMLLRSEMHRRGYRYRLHPKNLPGRPDMVLARHRLAIFVHGCFWHRHPGCRYATTPDSNEKFWADKFEANVSRDQRTVKQLRSSGWRVATIWECALRKHGAAAVADRLDDWLNSNSDVLDIGEDPL